MIPHFSMPLRFVDGAAVVTEQDSLDEITDCVANICRFTAGSRLERPDFGIPDVTFTENGPDAQLIAAAVSAFEPRAERAAAADGSSLEELVASVTITPNQTGGA